MGGLFESDDLSTKISNEWFEVDSEANAGVVTFKFKKNRLLLIRSQNESMNDLKKAVAASHNDGNNNSNRGDNSDKDSRDKIGDNLTDGNLKERSNNNRKGMTSSRRYHRYIVEVGLVVSLVETSMGGVSAINPVSGCPCIVAFELC
jgi:hypothetical protein